MKEVLGKIEASINETNGGVYKVKVAVSISYMVRDSVCAVGWQFEHGLISPQPKVVSDSDELELAKQLEKLEEANREVSGDEDSQEESEGNSEEDEEEEPIDDI